MLSILKITQGVILTMALITTAHSKEITIQVTNIEPERGGSLRAMVFAKDGFPKNHDRALQTQIFPADTNEIKFKFSVSDSAPFAVKILHDENEDGKVTKNWTGVIPSEGLGFTNGAKLSISGAPSFNKARLDPALITAEVSVPMIYPRTQKKKQRKGPRS